MAHPGSRVEALDMSISLSTAATPDTSDLGSTPGRLVDTGGQVNPVALMCPPALLGGCALISRCAVQEVPVRHRQRCSAEATLFERVSRDDFL